MYFVIFKQVEKEMDGCCGSTAASETGLERFVAITSRESSPYLATEFREPSWNLGTSVHQIVPENISLLQETSVCVTDKASLDVEVVNHGLEGTNPNFEVNVDQSRPPTDNGGCLINGLGSAPSKILIQVSNNNPDGMHCGSEDEDLVTVSSENLPGSSTQGFDAGEERIETCISLQSFSDAGLVTHELHEAKRRKLISLGEGLPAN